MAQMIKNLPAIQETWLQSLGWEDPLEKGMTTHSSILAWRVLWTEEPGELQSMGSQRVRQRCTGTTQREGMGREEGGGFRMGNTGIPVADSFRYLAKLIQYCKV